MSFLDKIKSGMAEAGSKAKILVEANKLKLVNINKQSQIEKHYKAIGERVSQLHTNGEQFDIEQFNSELEAISILKFEIEQNEMQIEQLSDEKKCLKCQKENPIDARICIHCKQQFDIIDVANNTKTTYIE